MSVTTQGRGRRPGRIGRPPGASREATIARLVAAAQVQFGDRGYAGARLTEIARAAGVTHSSIYQYFDSKEELYRAAFAAAQAELLPEYLAAIGQGNSLRDQIAALLRASVRIDEKHPEITPFLASMPVELRRHPELGPRLVEQSPPLTEALSGVFAHARETGEIPAGADDMDLVTAFIGAAMGIGLLSYGLGGNRMSAAVEILLAALDGDLFDAPPS